MRSFFDFFARHSATFTFLLLATVSFVLLIRGNSYQQAVMMTSAGRVTSGLYSAANSVTSYFHLRSINEEQERRIADLELENINLRMNLRRANERLYADSVPPEEALAPYRFIVARVINNSIVRPRNYITLNRGEADGVRSEMGVIDRNGVVGIVNAVGPHASRVISLLNPDLSLSCKLKGSDAFGSLVWDGKSPRHALLRELPRHAEFSPGDTIITSGFSVVFPEGIPVGVIEETLREADDNFYTLRVRLTTDFSTLSTVRVIENFMKDEITALEQQ